MVDSELRSKLSRLPRLRLANAEEATRCKICGSPTEIFDVVDFGKFCSLKNYYAFGTSGIQVKYVACMSCSFVFTSFFDDWAKEDFSQFVYNDDYIKVDGEYAAARPEREAQAMARRLADLRGLRILDYGAGSGVFAERLGALGIAAVESYDPFSSPERPERTFDLLTCFEVLEHTPSPAATLADMKSLLGEGGCIVFSTGIQPPNIGELRGSWWYVAPRNGHVSIYSLEALALLGQSVGLTLYAGKEGLAFATARPTPASRALLASVGRPFRFLQLTAPEGAENGGPQPAARESEWHGMEGAGPARFRWTRRKEVQWQFDPGPDGPCRIKISIPFRMEVEGGFADQCQLVIGSKTAPLLRQGSRLLAMMDIEEPTGGVVNLITPLPRRPSELRQVPDARRLGLAIPTLSAVR